MSDYSSYMWSVPDWRTDEMYTMLDNREQGVYRNLLDECWVVGSISSDPEILARFVHEPLDYFAGVWAKIRKKFRSIQNGERLISKRQEEDRRRVDAIRKERKKRAKNAAETRWKPKPATTSKTTEVDASGISQALLGRAQIQIQTQTHSQKEGEVLSLPLQDSNTVNHVVPKDSPPMKTASAGRPRDLAMDYFSEKCLEMTGVPYVIERGDGVQLARLRNAYKPPVAPREMPEGWEDAVQNYFGSAALSQYTLADLSNPKRYAVFKNSALDEFNKPVAHANRRNHVQKSTQQLNAEAAQRLRARLDSEDSSGGECATTGREPAGVLGAVTKTQP